ncbi:MAG: hypothetical protein R3B45_12680 [Bdellovibrionota bacterium]
MKVRFKIWLSLIGLWCLFTTPSFSADILPLASFEPGAKAKTSNPKLLDKGQVKLGIGFDGSDLIRLEYDEDNDRNVEFGSGHQSRYSMSIGVLRNLELGLSIRGTTEIVSKYSVRDRLFSDSFTYQEVDGKKIIKETAYAGSIAFAKLGLLDHKGFNVSLMPFVEEGMGEKGLYTLTRARKGRAGWLALLGYVNESLGEITLNLGMRYQEPHVFTGNFIRNEMLGSLYIQGNLHKNFSVFSSVGARRLLIAPVDEKNAKGKPIYKKNDSGNVLGGVNISFGSNMLSLYGGSSLKNLDGYGNPQNIYGMSLSTQIGPFDQNRSKSGALSSKAKSKYKSNRISKEPSGEKDYEEMNGVVGPSSFESGSQDDFSRLREKMKRQHASGRSAYSEQEEVEMELAKIRMAEEKIEAVKAKKKLLQEQLKHKARTEQSAKLKKRQRSVRRNIQDSLDSEYSITVDDTTWNGLD